MKMFSLTLLFLAITSVYSEESVIPLDYKITIDPNLEGLTFTAETTITILVQEESVENVTLNFKHLTLDELQIFDSSEEIVEGVSSQIENNETIIIHSSNLLNGGLYYVRFRYSGVINEEQEGLYVATYGEAQERSIVLTNFRYDKASRVFPCFDSPSYPSIFVLRIVEPLGHVALANMVRTSSEDYGVNRTLVTFARTDPLPTYLVSFTLIDFGETNTAKNYSRVVVYSNSEEESEFLGDWSEKAVIKFEESETFKLDKIQIVVVPDSAISEDVLENIGLVIYRESAVLYDDKRENHEDKQEIAKLVTHSIVRQWYKVAPSFEWWPNFWTNQGITSLYQYNLLDALEPSWRVKEQYLVQELGDLLESDMGDNGIGLLLTESDTPDSFSEDHRRKSYAFVRMFSNLPKPGDILDDDDNAIALSWTKKTGYPILSATRDSENVLKFTQDSSNLRSIPISVGFEDQESPWDNEFNLILESDTAELNLSTSVSGSWYLVNLDRFGYFRTSYERENWRSVATFLQNIDSDKISPVNRAVLISDAFSLSESNNSSDIYLELVKYIDREEDYVPVYAFIRTANRLKTLLTGTDVQEMFVKYARNLTHHLYNKVGTSFEPSENHLDTLSRIKILTWLCSFGHELCQQEMSAILTTAPTTEIHPNLQEPVYCGGMRLGDLATFEFLKSQHGLHKKVRILRSMACTSDISLLEYYISAVIDQSVIIRLDDEHKKIAFFSIIEGSDAGVNVALNYVKQNFDQFLESFSDDDISDMFLALSRKLVTEEQAALIDEIISCLDENQNLTYGELFENVRSNVAANIQWRSSQVEVIRNWFSGHTELTTTTVIETTTEKIITEETTPTPGKATAFEISLFTLFAYLLLHLL